MLRISWPLVLFVAACLVLVARRPRLIPYVAGAFLVWFVVQRLRVRRPRR